MTTATGHATHTAAKRKLNGSHKLHARNLGMETADFAMQELGEVWSKAESSIKEHSADTKDKIMKYTKQHPLTALGGAVLTGALLALLFRR